MQVRHDSLLEAFLTLGCALWAAPLTPVMFKAVKGEKGTLTACGDSQRKGMMGWKRQYYRLLQDSLFQFTSHDSKTPTDEVTLMGEAIQLHPAQKPPHPRKQPGPHMAMWRMHHIDLIPRHESAACDVCSGLQPCRPPLTI